MLTSLGKRLLSLLLMGVLVFGLLSVTAPMEAQGADLSSLKNQLQSLQYPVGSVMSDLPGSMDGLWLIVPSQARDGIVGFVMNSHAPESENPNYLDDYRYAPSGYKVNPKDNTYVGYAVQPAYINSINEFRGVDRGNYTRITGQLNNCTFQSLDGRYWNVETIPDITYWAALRLRTRENGNRFSLTSAGNRAYNVQKRNSGNEYLSSNSWTFRIYRGTSITSAERKLYFCKVSEGLFEMCEALREASNYIVDNSTGQYDTATYDRFLSVVQGALEVYNNYCSKFLTEWSRFESDFKNWAVQLRTVLGEISVGDPYTVVLDYGRTTQVDLAQGGPSFDPAAGTRVSYVGAYLEGTHGAVSHSRPTDLLLTGRGSSVQTQTGSFTMATSTVVRFTPKTILHGATKLYGVYRVSPVGDPDYTLYYITKEICFVPGTSMYYETDFGGGIYTVDQGNSLFIPFSQWDMTQWGDPANITGYSKANGVLKGTINGGDPHLQMTAETCNLNYVVKAGDVVKVRIKSPTNSGTNMQVFFMTNDNKAPTTGIETYDTSYTPNGQWQIITLGIEPAVVGRTVQGIRIDPISNRKANGLFEIDWIYVGQPDDFNMPILTDFGLGDPTQWGEGAYHATVTKENGVIKGRVQDTDPYVRMTVASSTLSHIITEEDVVKVRIRSEACTGNNLQVFFMTDTNPYPTGGVSTAIASYTPNGQWQVITLKMLSGLVGKQIVGLRLDPTGDGGDINTFQKEGEYECDWIYVGPDVDIEKGQPMEYFTTSQEHPWQIKGHPNTEEAKAKLWQATEPYGYDASYNNGELMSGNASAFVIGAGIPPLKKEADENGNEISSINYEAAKGYTEATFTFTGTGLDIISRTGWEQADVRVYICDPAGRVQKTVSVFCKGENEFSQIPIVSVKNLDHGTYTVHIFVNAPYASEERPVLNRGGEFYFDAIRIYGTMDTGADTREAQTAYEAYLRHGEGDPTFKELRDILIEAGNFTAGGSLDGVVYLDGKAKDGTIFDDEVGRLEMEVAEYKEIGPNNEVYLSPGKALAFKLVAEGMIPASVDIGANTLDGETASMVVGMSTDAPTAVPTATARSIKGRTALYYPMDIPWQADGDDPNMHYAYVTIYNSGTKGVLAITDIKYAYDTPYVATAGEPWSLRFMVDRRMIAQYTGVCEHQWDDGKVLTQPTCTQKGAVVYTCTVCGETVTEETDTLNHTYVETVTAPTCTENGYTTYTCSQCGHSYEKPGAPATGHSYAEGNCTLCGAEDPSYSFPNPFVDVKEGDYFYTPVLWAVQEGITTGTSKTTFSPNSLCTRGQVVTFLWRASGSPDPTTSLNPFSDVGEKDYFYKAVLWAVEEGITTGTGKGKFSPEKECTRAQVATFLWRAMGEPDVTAGEDLFSDVAQGAYYYKAVLWAVEEGITNGTGKGKFSPDAGCTRGQIVTFLYRALAEEASA